MLMLPDKKTFFFTDSNNSVIIINSRFDPDSSARVYKVNRVYSNLSDKRYQLIMSTLFKNCSMQVLNELISFPKFKGDNNG